MPARSAPAALLLAAASAAALLVSCLASAAAEPTAAAQEASSTSSSSTLQQQPRVTNIDLWRRNYVLDNAGGASRTRSNVAVSRSWRRGGFARGEKAKAKATHAAPIRKRKKSRAPSLAALSVPGKPLPLRGIEPLEDDLRSCAKGTTKNC